MKKIICSAFFILCMLALGSAQGKAQFQFGSENYPGIQSGEVYITNISTDSYYRASARDSRLQVGIFDSEISKEINFEKIGWKTKRLGKGPAYDINGNMIKEMLPVFVQKSELKDAGVLKK